MEKNMTLKKNQTYTAVVERYGANGEGICIIDGCTVFVPYALMGETITLKLIKLEKRCAFGRLQEVLKPSPHRVLPPCPVFHQCGGCQLQHLDSESQSGVKQKTVTDALERIGGFNGLHVAPIITMQKPWEYRNKVQYPIGKGDQGIQCGFYAPRSHRIIQVDCCNVQNRLSEQVKCEFLQYMKNWMVEPYDEETHTGLVRHLIVRTSKELFEAMVIIVINGKQLQNEAELIEQLHSQIPQVVSIVINTNTQKTNVIMGEKNRLIYGKPKLRDMLGGLQFGISPHAFYQVNPEQTERLYAKALDLAALTGTETVVDAYCGIGTLSLLAAKRAQSVIGIEVVPQAIDDANQNAALNGILNAQFICGHAEVVMPQLVKSGTHVDIVIVDPPRKGCEPAMLRAILDAAPKRIVYVSCNPSTLARDLKTLCEPGAYAISTVQPVDMFPQTGHVETVVLMSRNI